MIIMYNASEHPFMRLWERAQKISSGFDNSSLLCINNVCAFPDQNFNEEWMPFSDEMQDLIDWGINRLGF